MLIAKQGFQAALAHQSTIFGLPHHFEKHPTMRNYLFSLIVCYTLIAPAFAKQPHYVEGKLVNYANPVYPRQAMENEEEGTSTFNVDFGAKKLNGTVAVGHWNPVALTAKINGNQFSGTSTAGIQTTGRFYGPQAAEMGGVFNGETPSNNAGVNFKWIGSFGAKKQ